MTKPNAKSKRTPPPPVKLKQPEIHEPESSLISFRRGEKAKTIRDLFRNVPDDFEITKMVSIGDRVSILLKREGD